MRERSDEEVPPIWEMYIMLLADTKGFSRSQAITYIKKQKELRRREKEESNPLSKSHSLGSRSSLHNQTMKEKTVSAYNFA